MPRKSSSSAGAIYLDRSERLRELRSAAHRAKARIPEIQRVILFGSLVKGIPTPRSDADILVIVESSPHERNRDRVPEMLAAFSPAPCPLDLFVFTLAEAERFHRDGSGVVRTALDAGIDLLDAE